MRKFLFLFFILLTVVAVSEVSGENKEKKKEKEKEKVVEEVLLVSEKVPQFKKGDFSKWVGSNVKYPQNAMSNGQEGRVVVSFVVDREGKVRDVAVARGSGYALLDQEAVRVVLLSPKWVPGKTKGQVVAVKMNAVVKFHLAK